MKRKIVLILLGIGLIGSAYAGYEHFSGRRCNPRGICTACKNCNGCKHCHYNGGKCSVCRR